MGKPVTLGDATGFIDPSTLATCVQQAKNTGWSAGVMVWQVKGDLGLVGISFNYYDYFRVIASECCSELDQDRTLPLVARMRVTYVLGVVMAI